MRAAIIGGDKRMLYAARAFYDSGFDVSITGFDDLHSDCGIEIAALDQAIRRADILVLPVPCARDGMISAPYSANAIAADRVLDAAGSRPVYVGMKRRLPKTNARVYDYAAREDFAYGNAALTAEGALAVAVQEYEGALFGARVLVCGFGRIGRILARDLNVLGARVTVAARKTTDRAYAEVLGYRSTDFSFAEKYDYDLVFNTVPAPVLHARALDAVGDNALLIDLASAPGGVDFGYAASHGITALHALSLPGRLSPAAAGRMIKDTIIKIIKEEDGGKEETGLCHDRLVLHL